MAARCGSAPHTQGTVPEVYRGRPFPRFSPAHAGNGLSSRSQASLASVQPRTRRERVLVRAKPGEETGSAPHTQGTDRRASHIAPCERFSPAHAGNGSAHLQCRLAFAVQPRTRRERRHNTCRNNCAHGSAPHTQGTAPRRASGARCSRFSPAHAGNGLGSRACLRPLSVQPRTRRERAIRCSAHRSLAGSAPHTQGTVPDIRKGLRLARFSPAHAGNGYRGARRPRSRAVQPRTRRER